jgi:hypothetical protein
MTIEDRLRQAVAEQTATVPRPEDRWAEIEARGAARRHALHVRRRTATWTVIGLVAVAAAAAIALPVLSYQPSHRVTTKPATGGSQATPAPRLPASFVTTTVPTTAPGTTTAPTTAPPTTFATAGFVFGYPPIWPFRTLAEARAWETAFRSGGQQPWHLDPGQTALSFTDGFLGYTEINKVVHQTVGTTEARVAVGFDLPNGGQSTAAVIHLVRFDAGADAPWEVVGTDDTTMSTALPSYGSVVGSPLAVGGTITGVDENISVQVRQPSSAAPLGGFCCQPAGGVASHWQVTVSFQGASDPVLTIASATGGHLQKVERFTVTAVRTGR